MIQEIIDRFNSTPGVGLDHSDAVALIHEMEARDRFTRTVVAENLCMIAAARNRPRWNWKFATIFLVVILLAVIAVQQFQTKWIVSVPRPRPELSK